MKHTDDTGDMLFHIENLEKRRGGREQGYRLLIRHLAVARGARLAITGPSGCGKSTTLDILGLALAPDSAETFSFRPADVAVNIRRLWRRGELDRMAGLRLAHMGYVLQTGGLLPFLPVADNMLLTARMSGQDEAEARKRVRLLAEQLGIDKLLGAMPATLSVGERQRAAIVRALVPRPALILADEPTAALDPPHAKRVMDLFLRAVEDQGGTLILVTHNADWALSGGLEELRFDVREKDGLTTAILDDGAGNAEHADNNANNAENAEHEETEAVPC